MKTVALCVGHSRKINGSRDGGAVSVGGVQEWHYNLELAEIIKDDLALSGIKAVIISEYQGTGYTSAMRNVAVQVKNVQASLAIELHFNAASTTATGHEWLYWHSSSNGKKLAEETAAAMIDLVPEIKPRGIKPKKSGDRGGEFLRLTHCPSMITEPFFGSNSYDWDIALRKKTEIAQAIAKGIKSVL